MTIAIPRKLIVLGDSGVYGWGDPDEGGWCERLRRHWMGLPSGPVLYPLGVRGDGLERVAARLEQEVHCRGELRRQLPHGILLAVGLNDSARVGRPDGRHQLDAEGFLFGLQQLLHQARRSDRSTDATADLAREAFAGSERALLLDAGPRPVGERWVGKNWAASRAATHPWPEGSPERQWLLFIDADVRLKPGALSAAMSEARREGTDLLSLAPRLQCGCLAEWLVQPIVTSAHG